MKNLFSILFFFVFTFTAYSATKIGYYSKNQTRDAVMKEVKNYDEDMHASKFKMSLLNIKNKYDFEKKWEKNHVGLTLITKVHYQFLQDKVLVTLVESTFSIDDVKTVSLAENETMKEKRDLYEYLEKAMITNFFRRLKITENNTLKKPDNTYQTQNYDSVNKYFSEKFTRKQSKKLATEYIDIVLKDAFDVKYLGSTPEDNLYSVKYTLDNEEGRQTAIVTYGFSLDGFKISINSINYFNKAEKTTTLITKNSTTEKEQKQYELLKTYFLDKHSAYILSGEYDEY